jgi:hypothetical protein
MSINSLDKAMGKKGSTGVGNSLNKLYGGNTPAKCKKSRCKGKGKGKGLSYYMGG